ncbi:MAG TPA: hypothetical protein VG033_09235 [Candidatus Acidoferrales bacterium]|nr:hypothetical protein [Candidatus Acidoferrales bacterium]
MGIVYAISRAVVVPVVLALGLAAPQVQPQVSNRLAPVERERDPVRRAKLLAKLSYGEFSEFRRQAEAANYSEAQRILEGYRDAVLSTEKALAASHINAERNPAGFKELQISLRRGLRQIGETMVTLTPDEREPFEAIRKELERADKELIHQLFPRQPDAATDKETH